MPPHGCRRQPVARWLTDVCYAMFVNTIGLHSVRFYVINATVIYEFIALLKFAYIIHAGSFYNVPFNSQNYAI